MGNKVKYNLKNVHAAKLTETVVEGVRSYNYATPRTRRWRERSKPCWMSTVFFMTRQRCGSTPRSCMRSYIHFKWRVKTWETRSNII